MDKYEQILSNCACKTCWWTLKSKYMWGMLYLNGEHTQIRWNESCALWEQIRELWTRTDATVTWTLYPSMSATCFRCFYWMNSNTFFYLILPPSFFRILLPTSITEAFHSNLQSVNSVNFPWMFHFHLF